MTFPLSFGFGKTESIRLPRTNSGQGAEFRLAVSAIYLNIPLNHVIQVPVFLRSHADIFPKLLYKMAL